MSGENNGTSVDRGIFLLGQIMMYFIIAVMVVIILYLIYNTIKYILKTQYKHDGYQYELYHRLYDDC